MIFIILLVASVSISLVKNDQVFSSFIDSEEVRPSHDTNTEKLFLELKFSRQREKDLNDTINQILEDMETMRDYILHLEETVTAVASEATRNTKNIEDILQSITELFLYGQWCAYQNSCTHKNEKSRMRT